jgi:hypothetical protein
MPRRRRLVSFVALALELWLTRDALEPEVSRAPASGEVNLATICWVRWLKVTYSAGERACSSWILASAVWKSRATSTHLKFTTSIFFRMANGGSTITSLQQTRKLSNTRRDILSESSKSAGGFFACL